MQHGAVGHNSNGTGRVGLDLWRTPASGMFGTGPAVGPDSRVADRPSSHRSLPAGMTRRPVRNARLCRTLPLLLVSLSATAAAAQERVLQSFGPERGLAAAPVWALAQDSAGFLWIGAEGGLFRFDGSEIRRWAADTIGVPVVGVAVSPDGEVVAVDVGRNVYRIEAETAVPVQPPFDLPPIRSGLWEHAAFDRDGNLWLSQGEAVLLRTPAGEWRVMDEGTLPGGPLRFIVSTPFGGALAGTDSILWRLRRGSMPERIFEGDRLVDAHEPEPGRVLALHHAAGLHARVVEIHAGGESEILSPSAVPTARAVSLRERHGTVWVSLDRYLLAVSREGTVEVLGRQEGVGSGGPLLIDREESLWLGSYVGLHHLPEPDTRIWAESQGLPSRHTRFIARSGDAVWVVTWTGTAWLRREDHGWTLGRGWTASSNFCEDGRGAIWASTGDSLVTVRGTTVTHVPGPAPGRLDGCTRAHDGGVWVGAAERLLHVGGGEPAVRTFAQPTVGQIGEPRPALLHDSTDRLWVAAGDAICSAPAPVVMAGLTDRWTCDAVPGAVVVTAMVELSNGALWAASNRLGLFVREADAWHSLVMPPEAPTRTVNALVASPRGGIWIVGTGILMRVAQEGARGLRILERLTAWNGLPAASFSGLIEDDDGDIWLSTNLGVVHVPASARFAEPSVPPIALVDARNDDTPIAVPAPLALPHDRNRLELRFAALSFRDRSRLHHQVRLAPHDPWSESHGEGSFRWVDLRPGDYTIEYRASLDGMTWSPEPIRFAFRVSAPWYATTWFRLLVLATVATAAWGLYRARVAHLVRLERQRTRIAMDLHDEVGSGLASVGILSGVLAHESLQESERRQMVAEIGRVAEELGHALSDIVWSLDPRTATLDELASRLTEHGGRLCADGVSAFASTMPERWPAIALAVEVRRNVLLVGLEALHNAVRHAKAETISFSLMPLKDGVWELAVSDDGVGFRAACPPNDGQKGDRRGHGLTGMRRRAAEIGADLDIRSTLGHGTVVILRFALHPRVSAGRGTATWLRRVMSRRIA